MAPEIPAFVIRPGDGVGGSIEVPGDKSISHRALLLGAIADGTTRIRRFLDSSDCVATLEALRRLGVAAERDESGTLIVQGAGFQGLRQASGPLNLGNSGTGLRLLTGLLCGQAFDSELTGDASLRRRPMARIAEPLNAMGAEIGTTAGTPPLSIRGGRELHGIDYTLPLASAQVKSALMLAGLYAGGETRIREPAVTRDHTERMFPAFGGPVERTGSTVAVRGVDVLQAASIEVPGDFSAAAFFIVAACIAGSRPLLVRGVGINPTRTGLLRILELMGADIDVMPREAVGEEPVADLRIRRSALTGLEVPPELVPLAIDEFPIVFVAAACARGETSVTGASELRFKESDRLQAMAQGLDRLGVRVRLTADGICIQGGEISGGRVESCGDHRVAMAFAVAGTVAREPVIVGDVSHVRTSFPGFVDTARAAGIDIAGFAGQEPG